MRIRTALGICLAFIFTVMATFPASSGEEEEKPEIIGPVPAYKEHVFKKLLHDRVYINVRYPRFNIPFVDKDIEKNANVADWRAEFKTFAIKKDEDGRVIPNERALSYDLYSSKKGILSVVLSSWFYFDTPHGYPGTTATTYDLASKKILRMQDIFPNWKHAEKELEKIMFSYLGENAQECADYGVGFPKEYTNFYIAPDGLTAVYSDLPIPLWGPCSAVFVEKEDLERIGANMRYWRP